MYCNKRKKFGDPCDSAVIIGIKAHYVLKDKSHSLIAETKFRKCSLILIGVEYS